MFQYFSIHTQRSLSLSGRKHGRMGEVPGHLLSNAGVPLSKVQILQVPTYTILYCEKLGPCNNLI